MWSVVRGRRGRATEEFGLRSVFEASNAQMEDDRRVRRALRLFKVSNTQMV